MTNEEELEAVDLLIECLETIKRKGKTSEKFVKFFMRQFFFSSMQALREEPELTKRIRETFQKMTLPKPPSTQGQQSNAETKTLQTIQKSNPTSQPAPQRSQYEMPDCKYLGELVRKSGCSCKNHTYKCNLKNLNVKLKECSTCSENQKNPQKHDESLQRTQMEVTNGANL